MTIPGPTSPLQAPERPVSPGRVFGGIVRLPASPDADMHGLLRAVVVAKLFTHVIVGMERLGVHLVPGDLGRTWGLSSSQVEHEVTEGTHGEVFTCPLTLAYLSPAHYHRHQTGRIGGAA